MKEYNLKEKIITIFLIITNIVVFIIYTISGDVLYNMGSLSAVDIIERKEYYRVVSCMFMHGDVEHIMSNMIFLAVLGEMLEKTLGHAKFTALYMIAGIGSSFCSVGYELLSGQFYHSVGASGAVCGLLGALLVLVIRNDGHFREITLKRMILGIFYLVYTGLRSPIVNNAAHIGGLVIGFAITLCLYRKQEV